MLRRAGLILGLWALGPGPALAAAPAGAAAPAMATPAPAGDLKRALTRWEYKVITYNRVSLLGDNEAELRLLGLQGWEMVSAFFDPNARTIVCFLKRPVGEK